MNYDVFNGDADGLFSLQQLRLAEPTDSVLVTGVKRDIALLQCVPAQAGDAVTVLDIAVEKNLAHLQLFLDRGLRIRWFDHHLPGPLPTHPHFEAFIDTDHGICTALLVDRFLEGRHRAWAVAAAFGDNLPASARLAAAPLELPETDIGILRSLGELVNYNAYGDTVADLHIRPDVLYGRLRAYADPIAFARESEEFRMLQIGYASDMEAAQQTRPFAERREAALYILPDAPWARRISGPLANQLANTHPDRAHAIVTRSVAGNLVVSVRAPSSRPTGADALCRKFATGGGRRAAAGINALPDEHLADFERSFFDAFASQADPFVV